MQQAGTYMQPGTEKVYLENKKELTENFNEIVGESNAIKETLRLVSLVARSETIVLILGETGTGKELIAKAIHEHSTRCNKPMIKVNCAALPVTLVESELFGHERGSFTGAIERRIGKFELAHQSTLFLDEIGEIPLESQAKMLRALQEKEIERIGGRNTIKADARIIAATNRNLEKEMEEGRFRPDLFYRLNIFPIELPPLRSRRTDIPLLVQHFIGHISQKTGKRINMISNKAMQQLLDHNWPGNIRELGHTIERSILLSEDETIRDILLSRSKKILRAETDTVSLKTIDENERDHILKVLWHCKSRINGMGGAAEILGVPASTLHSKIKRLGIRRKHILQN